MLRIETKLFVGILIEIATFFEKYLLIYQNLLSIIKDRDKLNAPPEINIFQSR